MNNFCYKGTNKTKDYFEGWYLRLVDTNNNLSYSIIFGISLYENDPHSFIQIINNQTEKSDYLRFGIDDFIYEPRSIKIKDNILSQYELNLKLQDLTIHVENTNLDYIETKKLTPGAMGFFKYLPLCTYHEIIYLEAKTKGTVVENNKKYDFDGTSYMEKNWGTKFPKKWLWTQTNHFDKNANTKFILVFTELFLVDMPVFLCILKIKEKEYRFATYNGSRINILKSTKDEIILTITKGQIKLNITINYNDEYPIIAPIKNGRMIKVIGESINSTMSFSLYKNSKVMLKDTATNVACENLFINQ